MARKIPSDRLDQLVARATAVFIDQGYRHTQMAGVAEAMGIAKGTLYLYVESKEALFDLVCRCADVEQPLAHAPKLPIPTPKPGATLRYVRERLAKGQVLPALTAALRRRRADDPRAELEAVVRELYELSSRNRTGIKLVDRCARDYPELAALWYQGGREHQLTLLTQYIDTRIRQKQLRPVPDIATAARVMLETIVTWAVHRYWDPAPHAIDEEVAKNTVVQFIVGGLAKEEGA